MTSKGSAAMGGFDIIRTIDEIKHRRNTQQFNIYFIAGRDVHAPKMASNITNSIKRTPKKAELKQYDLRITGMNKGNEPTLTITRNAVYTSDENIFFFKKFCMHFSLQEAKALLPDMFSDSLNDISRTTEENDSILLDSAQETVNTPENLANSDDTNVFDPQEMALLETYINSGYINGEGLNDDSPFLMSNTVNIQDPDMTVMCTQQSELNEYKKRIQQLEQENQRLQKKLKESEEENLQMKKEKWLQKWEGSKQPLLVRLQRKMHVFFAKRELRIYQNAEKKLEEIKNELQLLVCANSFDGIIIKNEEAKRLHESIQKKDIKAIETILQMDQPTANHTF